MGHCLVADLTVDEFKNLIRESVIQALTETSCDPDEGLELRDDFKIELQRSLAAGEAGGKTVPVQEIVRKLGLTW